MAANGDIFFDFDNGLHKVGFFLQDILRSEELSPEAEAIRQECIRYLEEMTNTLTLIKQNEELSFRDGKLMNLGLSQSSQTLNEPTDEFELGGMPRSGSMPNIPTTGEKDPDSWGSGKAKTQKDFEPDMNFRAMREIVIYDPIEEEEEDEDDDEDSGDEGDKDHLNVSNSSRISLRRSRKRDSAVLFDITLGDLEGASDLSGILTEKHSSKEWWCVLMDQHLCLFPSRDPDELAYDVVILPCCQISLDDRLMRTPVFRLTQPGMTPWVLVANDNEELKNWIKALTMAASGGKYTVTPEEKPQESWRSGGAGNFNMQAITEEEGAEEEEGDQLTNMYSLVQTKPCEIIEEEEEESEEKQQTEESKDENENKIKLKLKEDMKPEVPETPQVFSPPESNETFGEDIYEAIEKEDFEDDGFATDEFESGSSDNESPTTSPKSSPRTQRKTKKKNQLFKWLKKKAKSKDRLFSSPQDGVALAGYVHRLEDNALSKRWCVIREGKLYCYKTIKDEDTELTLELDGADIRAKEEDKNKFIVRVIKDNERLIALAAKNSRDMERWKTALRIESGFIKLATPGDTSSGVYEDDDADYVTPLSPIGLQRVTNGHARTVTPSEVESAKANADTVDASEENPYVEVVFSCTESSEEKVLDIVPLAPQEELGPIHDLPRSPDEELGPLPRLPRSPEEELGPLPPLPVDAHPPALPPRRSPVPQGDIHENESESEDSEDFEDIYEEVHCGREKEEVAGDKMKSDDGTDTKKGPIAAGMEDRTIEDEAISASSYKDKNSMPHLARLHSQDGAWCALECDRNQYLDIDLGAICKVCGVATQGRPSFTDDGGWFVKNYTLSYSKNNERWKSYKEYGIAKQFQGNTDPDGVVTNMFKVAVNARYVRFKPHSWHNHIAMRVEIYKGDAGSKLTAGIHKLAGSITKAGKNMLHEMKPVASEPEKDVKNTPPSPRKTRAVSFDERKSAFQKPPLARKVSFDEKVKVINDSLPPSLRPEATSAGVVGANTGNPPQDKQQTEKQVESSVSAPPSGVPEVARPSEKDVRSLPSRALRETWIKEGKKQEEHGHYGNVLGGTVIEQDKEREILQRKEEEFLEMAKQLKREGSAAVRGKRGSLVAQNKITFENRDMEAGKESRIITRSQALLKEKSDLVAKMEAQKRRVNVAKDRKIFFTLTTNDNTAAADAETEFHESQLELARAKKRIAEIDNELKTIRLLDLKNQTVVMPVSPKHQRLNVTIPTLDGEGTGEEPQVVSPRVQKGNVLSQIKAFEQLRTKK